jgi:5-methyltetrahydrofolate corrinoid/iron sulfur protein methyltransferase
LFIIGELINGMYASVGKAIRAREASVIQERARAQVAAGAHALDVNCGPASRNPVADMPWLIEVIQQVVSVPLSLDSSNPSVIEAGLKVARSPAIINSTTADPDKLAALIPLAKRYGARLIGLTIDARGIPHNKDQRLQMAAQIVAACAEQEFPIGDVFIDPIVVPVNVSQAQISDILEAIREFRIISDPAPHVVVGLSNVSQGTAVRSLINRTFLTMAIACGLDAAILDPLDTELMNELITAELLLNKQIYCDSFLNAYRKG